jgi:hypothetical protein
MSTDDATRFLEWVLDPTCPCPLVLSGPVCSSIVGAACKNTSEEFCALVNTLLAHGAALSPDTSANLLKWLDSVFTQRPQSPKASSVLLILATQHARHPPLRDRLAHLQAVAGKCHSPLRRSIYLALGASSKDDS